MSKIKSIKLKTNFWFYKKGKVFTFAEFQEALDSYCSNAPEPMQVDQESTESYLLESPEDFEIKHEKPQILKRPDGSVISGLEEGQEILLIADLYSNKKIDEVKFEEMFIQDLHKGLIFLPEDPDLAEKKAKMLSKQLEIQYEIDRLNAVEHPSIEKEWHIGYFQNNDKIYKHNLYGSSKDTFMSELTAETILAKYSQDELKQYSDIII
jgi:hypothetical protein